MKKYDLIKNSCIISVLSLALIFTAVKKDKYVDIGDNLYECEFAFCDGSIKLIRPIGDKNYYDIINNSYFLKDNATVISKAYLVDFLTDEQINDILSYKISKEELIEVFDYVCDINNDEWFSSEVNINNNLKVKNLKR